MVEWISVARQRATPMITLYHCGDHGHWRHGAGPGALPALPGEPSPRSHHRTTTEISTQSGLALVYGCNFNPNFSRNGQTLFKIWEFMHVVVHQTLFSCRIIRKWGTFLKKCKNADSFAIIKHGRHGQYIKCHQILTFIKHKAKS